MRIPGVWLTHTGPSFPGQVGRPRLSRLQTPFPAELRPAYPPRPHTQAWTEVAPVSPISLPIWPSL